MSNENKRKQAEETLVTLLEEIPKELLRRLKSGEATNQDISNAIKLLHNNGITIAIKEGEPLGILAETLPFESDESLIN